MQLNVTVPDYDLYLLSNILIQTLLLGNGILEYSGYRVQKIFKK